VTPLWTRLFGWPPVSECPFTGSAARAPRSAQRSHRTRTPRRSHCLRSRPATPTVFATAPAPEAANDSAAAASARRSSAEGSVADAALSAACAERSKASRPSAIGPCCHCLLSQLWKTTDSRTDLPRPIRNSTYGTRQSRSPLVGRMCRPPLATRLPSSLLKTSIFSAGIVI
jgi:hypothetical protein